MESPGRIPQDWSEAFESLDYWNQYVNENIMQNENKKLDDEQRKSLIDQLNKELG